MVIFHIYHGAMICIFHLASLEVTLERVIKNSVTKYTLNQQRREECRTERVQFRCAECDELTLG